MRNDENFSPHLNLSSPLHHIVGITPAGSDNNDFRRFFGKPPTLPLVTWIYAPGQGLRHHGINRRWKSYRVKNPERHPHQARGECLRLLRQVSRVPTRSARSSTRSSGLPLSNPNTPGDELSAANTRTRPYYSEEVTANDANHEDTLTVMEHVLTVTNTHLSSRSEGCQVTAFLTHPRSP